VWDQTVADASYYQPSAFLAQYCGPNQSGGYGIGPFVGTANDETIGVYWPNSTFDVWEFDAAQGDTVDISVDTRDPATAFTPYLVVTDDTNCIVAVNYGAFACTYDDPNGWYGSTTVCPALAFAVPATGRYRVNVSGYSNYSSGGYVSQGSYRLVIVNPAGGTPSLLADDEPPQSGPMDLEATTSLLTVVGP
jgi:hypothetical protein